MPIAQNFLLPGSMASFTGDTTVTIWSRSAESSRPRDSGSRNGGVPAIQGSVRRVRRAFLNGV
jgi:hypothetical protein